VTACVCMFEWSVDRLLDVKVQRDLSFVRGAESRLIHMIVWMKTCLS
jgi:hypothetical protein